MEVVAENYQLDSRISFFQNLDDIGQPYFCDEWSEFCGSESFNIVDDGNVGIQDHFLKNLFALDNYWHNIVVIDHNLVFRHFISCDSNSSSEETVQELEDIIEQILFEMNYVLGDVNYDGILNIQDVILLVNVVMDNGYNNSMDVNFDNTIDILDIIQIVNMIIS